MIFLYPLRPVSLLLTLIASFMIWLPFWDIFSFIVVMYAFPLAVGFVAYFKYLFLSLERFANGYTDSPPLTWNHLKPFTEMRQYQLLMLLLFIISLASWLISLDLEILAWVLITLSIMVMPAFIGLLGIHSGFFDAVNPVNITRFIQRAGVKYLVMWMMLLAGSALIRMYYDSNTGLFTSVFITLYFLSLTFIWIGRTIYEKRDELGYLADNAPEREAQRFADEILVIRKDVLHRFNREKHLDKALPALLAHIETEDDKLGAHAWYYRELMQWDNKRHVLRHAVFYVRELRGAGKGVLADLIIKECQGIDPEFDDKIPG